MTRQTSAPLEHTHLASTLRQARELARNAVRGDIDLDPPYQRGQVWTEDQRIALVRSWLLGLPTGVVILSDRAHAAWTGPDPDAVGGAVWAVVDGKQRLSAAVAWFDDGFAVPASWIAPEFINHTSDTANGPYVYFSSLTVAGQRWFVSRALFAVAEFRSAATIHDEAEIYLLVNGGGTVQTQADMQRARDHAVNAVKEA